MSLFGIKMPWLTPVSWLPVPAGAGGVLPAETDPPAANCFQMADPKERLRNLLDPKRAAELFASAEITEEDPEPLSEYIDWDRSRLCYVCRMPSDIDDMYIGPAELAKGQGKTDAVVLQNIHIYRAENRDSLGIVIHLLAGDYIAVDKNPILPNEWAWLRPGAVMDLAPGFRIIFEPEPLLVSPAKQKS